MENKKLVINKLPTEVELWIQNAEKEQRELWEKIQPLLKENDFIVVYDYSEYIINCSKEKKFFDFIPKPVQAPKLISQHGSQNN